MEKQTMSTRNLSVISSIITVILLIVLGILASFVELVALNGYSDREGGPALIAFGICQVVGLLLCALLAGWLTKTLAPRFSWNKILTVIISILAATLLSGGLWILSVGVSVIVAEGLR
jgi:sulfite exporter TauE/SafE